MSKPPGTCIFCGKVGDLSKEHVWSDWLEDYLPEQTSHQGRRVFVHFADAPGDKTAFIAPSINRPRQGALGQRKIRKVCKNCNRGWMSEFVQAAKPYVVQLIRGDPFTMNSEGQMAIAGWATISVIMAEFLDLKTAKIPQTDWHEFYRTKSPLKNWNITLGRYTGSARGPHRYSHIGADFRVAEPESDVPADFGYFQVTVNTMLGLAILAFSSSHASMVHNFDARLGPLAAGRIWPPATGTFDYFALPTIGDFEIEAILNSYFSPQL